MKKSKRPKPALHGTGWALLFLLIICVDRVSKSLAERVHGGTHTIVDGWLGINVIHHRGTLFGLVSVQPGSFTVILIILINILAVAGLTVLAIRQGWTKGMRVAGFVCMIGGACGNIADRVLYGYVVDFLEIGVLGIFNVADLAIGLGIVLICTDIMKTKRVVGH